MSVANDARFWDRSSRKYAAGKIADQAGYERTLERSRSFLRPAFRVLELGCGTGTTAFHLADEVESYLATDVSSGMIAIAEEKHLANPVDGLAFRVAAAEDLDAEVPPFDVVVGMNYLHLVRELPATLRHIQGLLSTNGIFISKTPCLGDMNPLIRLVLVPAMRAVRMAPFVRSFRSGELSEMIADAGFEIVCVEDHAAPGTGVRRPFIVARKV